MFFGRIPETHIKSLQSYPWIFFNDLTEAKLDYSVETTDKSKPTLFVYDLISNPVNNNDQLDKRCKALEDSVRKLFWKEAKIQIKLNGEEVFKSE